MALVFSSGLTAQQHPHIRMFFLHPPSILPFICDNIMVRINVVVIDTAAVMAWCVMLGSCLFSNLIIFSMSATDSISAVSTFAYSL